LPIAPRRDQAERKITRQFVEDSIHLLKGQFTLPLYIDLGATFVFALTGGLAALRRGYDVVGLVALAFVTALGGGLIRDGIFISQGPPALTTDARYILCVALGAGVSYLFREQVMRFNKFIAWLDAIGLGAYGVVGVQKSLFAGLSVPAAVLVGVVNAAGGGLLRDVLVREEPLVFKPGQFYVLAALAGCLLFVLLALQFQMDAARAALMSVAATFVFRMLAIVFNWKTRTLWEPPPPGSEGKD
jgi:uncharacterized membrane protein YeiH